jgi:hypothetical protein
MLSINEQLPAVVAHAALFLSLCLFSFFFFLHTTHRAKIEIREKRKEGAGFLDPS